MADTRKMIGLLVLGALALGLRVAAVVLLPGEAGPLAIKLLGCLAGAAVVPVLAWVGWNLVPERPSIGWCAAAVAAVYPPHVVLAAALVPSLWTTFALTMLIAVVYLPGWRATRRGAVMAGCLAGLLIPLAPTLAPAVPICLLLFWLAEGDVSWVGRFTSAAMQRVAIFAGIAALVVAPWLVHNRAVNGTWLPAATSQFANAAVDADTAATAELPGEPIATMPAPLARLKTFFLFDGAAQGTVERVGRIASVAWLVTAAIGVYLAGSQWRVLWPTYAIFAASTALFLCGFGTASIRTALEPLSFFWVAWTIATLSSRSDRQSQIRVYRPGEIDHDPFEQPHLLRGPHFDVRHQRRRAS